jgi:hypothetical protein
LCNETVLNWKRAIEEGYATLLERNFIDYKWVFKIKRKADG